uniref:Sushi domain-containing protein n=1 Tax=Otus sunia TaxID=257818 RepID=A0A8C8EDD1_9STRI
HGHRVVQCQLNNTWEPPTVFPVGRTVEYVCRPGYAQHLGMPPAITCLRNQTWSAALEFCKRKKCPNPGDPENGRTVVLTDLLFGSKVNYTCDKGYKLVGGSQRTCEVSGTRVLWSGDAPVCQRIVCDPPPDVPHGTHSGHLMATFSYADAVIYTCEPGYSLAGEPSIFCTTADGERGVWSRPPPRCGGRALPCPETTGLETMYRLGDLVVFECDFGYALKGSQESHCQFGGTWDPPLLPQPIFCCFSLPVINCASPKIQHGEVAEGLSTVYPSGANVTFRCHPGYVLWGSHEAKCQPDGRWVPCASSTCRSCVHLGGFVHASFLHVIPFIPFFVLFFLSLQCCNAPYLQILTMEITAVRAWKFSLLGWL